jgi:hypothetical protein
MQTQAIPSQLDTRFYTESGSITQFVGSVTPPLPLPHIP